jgi:hypothetical protein
MTEERLREIFRADDGEVCDRGDSIWAAAHGELHGAPLEELLGHLRGCGACAADWALAVEARRAQEEVEEPKPQTGSARGMPKWASYVAPLVVLAATLLGLALWAWTPDDGADQTWRAGQTHGVVLSIEDGAVAADRTLRWEPVQGAVSYDVVVLSEDGRTLGHAKALTEPVWRLGDDVEAGPALWRVEARMQDGGVRKSGTYRVTVP